MIKKNLLTVVCILFLLLLGIQLKTQSLSKKDLEKPLNKFSFIGTNKNLYISEKNKIKPVFQGKVKKILLTSNGFFFLTSKGVVYSKDRSLFQLRNHGIQNQVIKNYQNQKVSFFKQVEDLKDIAYDINNPNNLITASKRGVYISRNQGRSWKFYSSPSHAINIKSVAIYTYNNQIHAFFGHPYEGVYYMNLSKPNHWTRIYANLSVKGGYREEISSLQTIPNHNKRPILVAAQNFQPAIYKLNWQSKTWSPYISLKKGSPNKVKMLESIYSLESKNMMFVTHGNIYLYQIHEKKMKTLSKVKNFIDIISNNRKEEVLSLATFYDKPVYSINELWLLNKPHFNSYKEKAFNKRGVYSQADIFNIPHRLKTLLATIKNTRMNMITVDMKDDYGKLRFKPSDPFIKNIAQVINPVNLEKILPKLKKNNIYVVARIPIFKDKLLHNYNNGELSIKDKTTGKSWRGVKSYRKDGSIRYNHEFWVDPYNPKVWEYNEHISQELLKRGFDEVQFDYIRFPTDGKNLSHMMFPSQAFGMSKDSALISFLRYMRKHIKAPISIDIYGANGWLRTSARTGQDVEMLAEYVDVIAPMYYPSHFSKYFLNYAPYEKRPYRIYNIGSYRNYYIARQKVVIRPYVQAFKLSFNPYDKAYYNTEYVNEEILGIQDSINMGYTFWNAATRYSILNSTILTKKKF